MRLYIPADKVNLSELSLNDGATLKALIVGGAELSLMVADRPPGYHSIPHTHPAEQLNYVLEGQLWVFVEDEGFQVARGDFFRIPRDAVHWSWVAGEQTARIIEAHSPGLAEDPLWHGSATCFDWKSESGTIGRTAANHFPQGLNDHVSKVEANYVKKNGDLASPKRGPVSNEVDDRRSHLYIPGASVKSSEFVSAYGGTLSAQVIGGAELSIQVAERNPGYHSTPHYHTAEQLVHMMQGSMWVFVEDQGFHVEPGDFFRVPHGATHWAVVTSDVPMRVFEAHSPGVARAEMWHGSATSFNVASEPNTEARSGTTHFLSGLDEHMAAVEATFIDRA